MHKNLIFALAAAEALLMFSELAKTNQVSSPESVLLGWQEPALLKRYCQSKQEKSGMPFINASRKESVLGDVLHVLCASCQANSFF